ncbi:hypothetical protein, partial [Salmonella enterica]|uniref:hypothetical protein n=1 Tax=Salmonella enterica TaxID=28901 RepID=UPI003299F366
NRIITNPVGTVFRLDAEEEQALIELWNVEYLGGNKSLISAVEGTLQLKSHYRRERSRKLISQKKEQYKRLNGL